MPRAKSPCKRHKCPHTAVIDGWCAEDYNQVMRFRGTTTERGYGAKHQERRKETLPGAIGKPCPLCGRAMRVEHDLDFHHSVPLVTLSPEERAAAEADQIVHTACNLAADKETGYLPPGKPLPQITMRRIRRGK